MATPSTGTNSAFKIDVSHKPQTVSGMRNIVMPGARSRSTVVM